MKKTNRKQPTATSLAITHYVERIKARPVLNFLGLTLPGIGATLVFYIPPLIIARILFRYGHNGFNSFNDFIPYIALFAGVWALGELVWRIAIMIIIRAQTSGVDELYTHGMDLMLAKDIRFFDDNFAGSLTKKVVAYANNYINFCDTLAFSILTNLIPLLFAVVILWTYSPWLVVCLIGSMALTGVFVYPLIKRRRKLVDAREKSSNILSGNIADTIGNIATVRTYAQEKSEMHSHKKLVKDYVDKAGASWSYQNNRIDIVTSPLYILANTLGLTIALSLSKQGILNVEVLFVAFSYYIQATRIVWEFNNIYRNLESSITEAAQFTELLLHDKPTITDNPDAPVFELESPSITVRDISFTYTDTSGEHLFKNLNLGIAAGEKIGLVGPSGGGKSTIAKLLLRLMDVSEGAIEVDGRDIKSIRQTDLRRYIGYVPQDPLLFHRSLSDNIRYGRPEATQDEVEAAAKLAYAHDFITELPQGYDTLVGERGVKLSGGQRQRIAIARAILKDAPILVLDEATSALDSESERYIQDALANLMKNKTAIVIAHRLSTIQKMDRIVVLENGEITEQGSHQELLDAGGHYATLWAHQSGGFLED